MNYSSDKKIIIVTVDTEPDLEWSRPELADLTCENAKSLPKFQSLCERYNIKPVYLVDHVMASNEFAADFLHDCVRKGNCEIGAHMHPWSNPPFDTSVTNNDYKYHPFITEYPLQAFASKLDKLKRAIETQMGSSPTTFRAGRWVIDKKRIQILKQNGFTVDCSVTPYRHWEKERQAPGSDYSDFGPEPFYWDEEQQILEVPLSGARFSARYRGRNPYELPIVKNYRVWRRVLNKFLARKQLDIKGGDWLFRYKKFDSILLGVDRYISENNERILQSMLHSSELHLGSCFHQENDLRRYWRVLEESFSKTREAGFTSMTLSEFRTNRSTDYTFKETVGC
jgi:hypothetical protein